jgi:hypothetical protein
MKAEAFCSWIPFHSIEVKNKSVGGGCTRCNHGTNLVWSYLEDDLKEVSL